MAYADQQLSGNKIIAIIIVALIHVALGYALITGLAYSAASAVIERVTTIDIDEPEPEPEPEEPPPPEEVQPQPETIPPPVAPPPPISVATRAPPIRTQVDIPPPAPPRLRVPPPRPSLVQPPPAPPPPPPAPSRARGVQVDGNWQSRIVNEGYPSRAISRELEGTVGVRVQVGSNGRVASCSVTNSSGESILDQGACSAMERYARFRPALNDAGDPITGNYTTSIVYRLN